jgi:hypothetical protein
MPPHTLTKREQDLLAEHLPYELDQLEAAFVAAASPATRDVEKRRRLIAIDCFYLHARNLIEFYMGNETDPTKTRVHAIRFTTEPQTYPSFKDFIDIINDQVTHLQLARGDHAEQALDGAVMTTIKSKLDSALETFQRHLTDEAKRYWCWREKQTIPFSSSHDAACTAIYSTLTGTAGIADLIKGEFLNSECGEPALLLVLPSVSQRANNG